MITDWLLMRRAAVELNGALRHGRVTDVGALDDGRVAVRFGGLGRGAAPSLAIDAFASPPLLTLEDEELALRVEPGWLRTVGTSLRGMRLSVVEARTGDRVVVLTFGAASRFGVASESRLVLELVPRYGNIVLLRERQVVAAAKQFTPAENEARAVQVGLPYEPPPLPQATLDGISFAAALAAAADSPARTRALGGLLPALPRLLAASVIAESDARPATAPPSAAAWVAERAAEVLAQAEAAAREPGALHLYRDERGLLVAAHVVPLAQYAQLAHATAPALLPLFAEGRRGTLRDQQNSAAERRRSGLSTRVARRARAATNEAAQVVEHIADSAARERFRRSGDALYTHAHEIDAGATAFVPSTDPELRVELDPDLDAKANAQRYYARYRKAANALPHLELRRAALVARLAVLDEFAFEIERADAGTLIELEADLDALEGRPPRRAAVSARKRAPLRLDRPSGARIYVGRSPRENAEVTFRIARPDDLWFHARGVPGSHVVLQAAPGAASIDDDVAAAANLAAAHSRARAAGRVEVDYTERKHVRKQRDGAPGQVWYTHARTRLGDPERAAPTVDQPTRAR